MIFFFNYSKGDGTPALGRPTEEEEEEEEDSSTFYTPLPFNCHTALLWQASAAGISNFLLG